MGGCVSQERSRGSGALRKQEDDLSDTKKGNYRAKAVMACLMATNLGVGIAAPAVIGVVAAQGSFQLDDSTVTGNATLFEGASVETRAAGSSAELSGGARVLLGPDSKGRFFNDRMILEKGEGRLERTASFRFEARGLAVRAKTGGSSAWVALAGGNRVQVAALEGSFQVLNAQGLLVANLAAGRTMEFEPQTAAGPSRLSGCLQRAAGHFVLTDETTNAVVELAGPGLNKAANNRIEAVGSMDPTLTPVPGASEVILVSGVRRTGKACSSRAASAAAAGGGSPRASAGGSAAASGSAAAGGNGGTAPGGTASGGTAAAPAGGVVAAHAISLTTIAVIGGVAAAATVGGLAAAGTLPGQGSSNPSISR